MLKIILMQEDLPYCKTGFFSNLLLDYLDQNPKLKSLYSNFPAIENFENQINSKAENFNSSKREVLYSYFKKQYQFVDVNPTTQQQIESLSNKNTFTVTTGHQLNIFTGPLYFIYKIVSTINLCKQLKKAYPGYNFIPIYWMATEDHDFDEISFFHYQGEKIKWKQEEDGAVGRMKTTSIHPLVDTVCDALGDSESAIELKRLLIKSYKYHSTLAEATFYLVNQLFANEGLLVIDADQPELKRQAIPYFKEDLISHIAEQEVNKDSLLLEKKGYSAQVNPREINLFYLKDGLRERIISEDEDFLVVDTSIRFTKNEILNELETHPERFSPNVILRPLYQEVILPNLCYIGGGGELAYWMQLKQFFEASGVVFPMLLLRNSALLYSKKQAKKLNKLNLELEDLFLDEAAFKNKITHQISAIKVDFSDKKNFLRQQFKDLYQLAEKTDASFLGAVAAQEQKQINGLQHLEKRLLKAQKRKYKDHLDRANQHKLELFPGHLLQERHNNFMEYHIESQGKLIDLLLQKFDPLKMKFDLIQFD